ncbi:carboxylesterase/lipase family protein [Persicimonas caeni]|nr:carboxylesterase family protein [Persicimonas caeni]
MNRNTLAICLLAASTLAACGDDTNSNPAADTGADTALEPDAGDDVGDGVEDADSRQTPEGRVDTTEGPVQGTEFAGVWAFKGIPYAQPPVGEHRWKPPRAPAVRDGIFEAKSYGYACPQDASNTLTQSGPTDEDCLTLNIWTSQLEPEEPLPVMFWIHGGGFIQGSTGQTIAGGTEVYDGVDLALEDVVVVTINYRLGALGFLAHEAFVGEDGHPAAGNYGLLDQIQALSWVRDNIDRFGGDADKITIFGESAGGVSVCALMASPLTEGMFTGAIMESGNCLAQMRKLDVQNGQQEPATAQGERLAEAAGCADAGDVAACMRGKSSDEILEALPGSISLLGDGEAFEPIIDGHVLDKSMARAIEDGSAHEVPFVIGVNADEGTLFTSSQQNMTETQYEDLVNATFPTIGAQVLEEYPAAEYDAPWKALAAIVGDVAFVCPSRKAARAHSTNANATFTYFFTHVTSAGRQTGLGAFHASELAFVFGNFGSFGGGGAEGELSGSMQTWWTQFAYDGAPGSDGTVDWPAYDAGADTWLQLDTDELGPTTGVRGDYCDFWDAYL